jgi:hypothetical protein
MNTVQLWWNGTVHPKRAYDELRHKPAPLWALRIVVAFNIAISLTTILWRYLLGMQPLLPSWLTFLPTESYFLAEIFFLPVLRVAVWLLAAAIVHVGLRLSGHAGDMDLLLNMGGVGHLVIMPYTFLVDWLSIALSTFNFEVVFVVHGMVDLVWTIALQIVGLRHLFGLSTRLALMLTLISTALVLPLLGIFAR